MENTITIKIDDYKKDQGFTRLFLIVQQNRANDLLKTRGYLYLNTVYKMLDLPATEAGGILGWLYGSYVDFGIFDDCNKDFINGKSDTVSLNFNVDGDILKLWKEKNLRPYNNAE